MELGKICVSIAAAAAREQAGAVLDAADVIEIRLDSMAEPEVAKCCSLLRKPLLFTNRPTWEGGQFAGSEEERIAPLLEAVRLRAAYIDLELRAALADRHRLLEAMENSPTRMIISWHDFQSTPSAAELTGILHQMIASGAHIGKIVTTAHGPSDVLRVLALQEQARAAGFCLSCFCMGEAGRISRLATLYLGGYMTYACLSDAQATAPGQISVARLRELNALLR
ncbi:MAG: 3-dehydroquinate dehydratase [Candidatus Electronema aureum]|uniref:3-dehydroquinate dehydratase n=1 Tax=Candidatus Electronema aureum TaxID=2005002 RepID=A0A521FZL9_9BACT|nr:MAG: 3-dehydroquinate dehydratase [Candidatus Electronema aureum]